MLQSIGSQRVGHNLATEHQQLAVWIMPILSKCKMLSGFFTVFGDVDCPLTEMFLSSAFIAPHDQSISSLPRFVSSTALVSSCCVAHYPETQGLKQQFLHNTFGQRV